MDLEYGRCLINDNTKNGAMGLSKSDLDVGESTDDRYYEWMGNVLELYGK